MLLKAINRKVGFRTVLWIRAMLLKVLMCKIDTLGYKFVCPIGSNRQSLDLWTDPE